MYQSNKGCSVLGFVALLGLTCLGCVRVIAFKPALPFTRKFSSHLPRERTWVREGPGGDGLSNLNQISSMTVAEIRSELDLRGIKYNDVLEKRELVERLATARASGKADPSILNRFNEVNSVIAEDAAKGLTATTSLNINDITGEDGALPGGLTPDTLAKLVATPEVMEMLLNPKMQEIMRVVMTDGPRGMQRFLTDPEAMKMIEKLNSVLAGAGLNTSQTRD